MKKISLTEILNFNDFLVILNWWIVFDSDSAIQTWKYCRRPRPYQLGLMQLNESTFFGQCVTQREW